MRKESCQQNDKLSYSCQLFLSTCCLLYCLQVTPELACPSKTVNCHSSTMCWLGNCLARSIELLSNNLPLLHLCFSFHRTSILYSFNCRLLICFPVNRSEAQTRRNNSFGTVFSPHVIPYHGTLRSWDALEAVGFGQLSVCLEASGSKSAGVGTGGDPSRGSLVGMQLFSVFILASPWRLERLRLVKAMY